MKKTFFVILIISFFLISCEEKVTEPSSNGDVNDAYFTYPAQGTNVSGIIYITVGGTNIDKVTFRWCGNFITDETSPYKLYCNTTNYANGEYTIRAYPYFEDGTSTSITLDFWIAN